MVEIIGIVLAIQGIGGTINNALGDGGSWFLLNYVEGLEPYRLALHVAMAIVGIALVGVPQLRRWREGRLKQSE
ncbi:hypothetical protein [Agrococcus baldri]|uniref:Uncharacterized protein n=1 Tax=Agrococcus baldri TaxID=153730 RepID=A0AA87USB5_9MICO|nr:hypothetical protein [Agrococcus baldri]GEK80489.1 hypothetical protein ABA31_18400 [Agrococcus baldri]